MNLNRRDFIHAGFALGGLMALRSLGRAATAVPFHGDRGLLFDSADLPRIRANVQRPEFRDFWAFMTKVDFEADQHFLDHELRFTNHVTDMSRANVIALRSSFVHLVAPDERHLAIARAALAKVLGYPRWDWLRDKEKRPVGVMRGGGAALSLALISEWLAKDLTAEEQAAITHGIATEGGPSLYRGLHDMTHHEDAEPWSLNPDEEGLPPMQVTHWPRILDETNLRIVATAGLTAAAAHLHGRDRAADTWLEMARSSLKLYASRLPKDGSFPEGVGYWDYTFTHYIFALEVLRRKFGIDDRGLVDFPAQARFTLEMTMPTIGHPDDCISIGDAGTAAGAVPLSWIAREFRDGNAQRQLLQPGAIRSAWTTSWATVWYDPTVKPEMPADAKLDRRQALGIVISRTGWTVDDTVVAFRSGNPVNHEHADRNSLNFTSHGERLFNDPVHASYSTKDPKWLLRQTAAHTAVLIDGHGHIYHDGRDGTNSSPARAEIRDYQVGPNWMTVTSDATDAYRRAGLPVELVQRTLIYLKPELLAIFDQVNLSSPLPVQARFQVHNDDGAGRASVAGNDFTIIRPHASARGRVIGAGKFEVAAAQLPLPAASGVYPFAEIRSASAASHAFLSFCSAARTGEPHGEFTLTREDRRWHVAGRHGNQVVNFLLDAPLEGTVPVIKIGTA